MTLRRFATVSALIMVSMALAGCETTRRSAGKSVMIKPQAAQAGTQPVDADIRKILAAGGVDPGTASPAASPASPTAVAEAAVGSPSPLPAVPTPAVTQAPLAQAQAGQIGLLQAPTAQAALPQAPNGVQPALAANTAQAAAPVAPRQADFTTGFGGGSMSGFLPPAPVAETRVTVITGPDAAPVRQSPRPAAPQRAVAASPSPRVIEPQAPVQASSLPGGYAAPEAAAARTPEPEPIQRF